MFQTFRKTLSEAVAIWKMIPDVIQRFRHVVSMHAALFWSLFMKHNCYVDTSLIIQFYIFFKAMDMSVLPNGGFGCWWLLLVYSSLPALSHAAYIPYIIEIIALTALVGFNFINLKKRFLSRRMKTHYASIPKPKTFHESDIFFYWQQVTLFIENLGLFL